MPLALRNTLPTKVITPMTHTIHRHPYYSIFKDYVARCKIAEMNYLQSYRDISKQLGMGLGTISKYTDELVNEGWLRRHIQGNSTRSIYYRIVIDKNVAVDWRLMMLSSPRSKKSKSKIALNNYRTVRGT